jgi:hypothetical protein
MYTWCRSCAKAASHFQADERVKAVLRCELETEGWELPLLVGAEMTTVKCTCLLRGLGSGIS